MVERSPLRWEPTLETYGATAAAGTDRGGGRRWITSGRVSVEPAERERQAGAARFVAGVGVLALGALLLIVALPYSPLPLRVQGPALAFAEPPTRSSGATGRLSTTLRVAPLRVRYDVEGQRVEFVTRALDGSVPGPTLRVRRGDRLRVELRNELLSDASAPTAWNSLARRREKCRTPTLITFAELNLISKKMSKQIYVEKFQNKSLFLAEIS